MEPLSPPFEMLPPETTGADAAEWIYRTARHLLSAPVDAAMSAILEDLGRAAGADRAWMLEYDADLTAIHTTHEWCRRGVTPYVEDLLNTPVTMIGWLHEALVEGKAVMINDVGGLPRHARPLQVELQRQGNRSVLSVPIAFKGGLRAFFGFDAVTRAKRWPSEQVQALFRCGELIAQARYGGTGSRPMAPPWPASQQTRIYVRTGDNIRGVPLDGIVGLRAEGDYSRFHLSDGSTFLDMHALKRWEGVLPRKKFARIHRSAIVNISCVERLERRASGRWQLYLDGLAQAWNVSRNQVAKLRSRLGY